MRTILTLLILATAIGAAYAQASRQTHPVEVLSAETTTWTTYFHRRSASTTNTTCSGDGANVNCTSETTGARPASRTPINHVQVHLLVRMPDGNEVKAQCPDDCVKPEPGTYQAEIDKHDIRLLFQTRGRPDYNKDGTIIKPGKIKESWVKFSFEDSAQ
jgi:hypothetical protein